jgi:hypothetical protein
MKRIIIGLILLIGVLSVGCTQPKPIGGDKDAHGCLIAAGYSWCDAKQKCLRAWEENCTEAGASAAGSASATCPAGQWFCGLTAKCIKDGEICSNGMAGGDVDQHGCKPSAGYSWCASKQKCLRTWEEGCPA